MIIIIIIQFFSGIGIVFNVAGCLIRGRRRWSVTYTVTHGDYVIPNLEFGIERHFRRENLRSVDELATFYIFRWVSNVFNILFKMFAY